MGVGTTLARFVKEFRINEAVVKMMYNSVIFPSMAFGLKGSALTKANRNKLRRYESYILRTMRHHSKKTESAKTVHEFLGGKTVMRRIRVQRASYFGHIMRRPTNHLLQHAYRYGTVSRKIGRPCITWLNNLDQDREKYDYMLNDWIQGAENKVEIKTMAEDIYLESLNVSSDEELLSDVGDN